jgi:predicted enzyme related to lactoylglutathione lyase
MARVVHFEIPADKPERAVAFYQKVFDWKIEKFPGGPDYWLVTTGKEGEMGINGAIMDRSGSKSTVNTIGVGDLEESVKKVIAAGGKRLTPAQKIPGIGTHSYCTDPEGNWFGLLEPDMSARGGA